MGSRYVGIGYYALRCDSEDAADLTVTGTIQLWFMCEKSGIGRHRVFWCPLVPLQRTDRAPARGTIDDDNSVYLFGVSFDFSESLSHVRVVAGSPRLDSGPLGTTGASDSSSLVGFVQVYEYALIMGFPSSGFLWANPLSGRMDPLGNASKLMIKAILSLF